MAKRKRTTNTYRNNERLLSNLKNKLKDMQGPQLAKTVREILIAIQAESDQMVPRATSNLINSSFKKITRKGKRITGSVGYAADYALYVHEAPGTLLGAGVPRHPARLGNVWDPDGEPKFLIKAGRRVRRNQVNRIIEDNMRLDQGPVR